MILSILAVIIVLLIGYHLIGDTLLGWMSGLNIFDEDE